MAKVLVVRSGMVLAAALFAASSLAAGEKQTYWVRAHETLPVAPMPCVGSGLTLEVSHQLRVSSWFDAAGGVHVQVHFNTAYFRATDAEGNTYAGTHQINIHEYGDLASLDPPTIADRTLTNVTNIRLISNGPAPNLILTYRLILTVNATGEVAVQTLVDGAACVGD
jgi:hypothetical protein